ncbi:MAG TPA: hypothetical protein PKN13_13820, partial [Accumulibacter sp.]|nr:hypothetical protein [Accumulibacter sp.]HNL15010.1 hypothetical protein [Accumulibacter sp.]HNM76390.1 hypothetical protein [Accumulibacter sp.]
SEWCGAAICPGEFCKRLFFIALITAFVSLHRANCSMGESISRCQHFVQEYGRLPALSLDILRADKAWCSVVCHTLPSN